MDKLFTYNDLIGEVLKYLGNYDVIKMARLNRYMNKYIINYISKFGREYIVWTNITNLFYDKYSLNTNINLILNQKIIIERIIKYDYSNSFFNILSFNDKYTIKYELDNSDIIFYCLKYRAKNCIDILLFFDINFDRIIRKYMIKKRINEIDGINFLMEKYHRTKYSKELSFVIKKYSLSDEIDKRFIIL